MPEEAAEMLAPVGTTVWKGCKALQPWLRKSTRPQREACWYVMGKRQTSGRKLIPVWVDGGATEMC